MGIQRGVHLSTREQLPAHFGRIGKWISGMGWWGGGKGHLGFQIQELHDLGKKEFRGWFSVSGEEEGAASGCKQPLCS